MKYFLMCLAAIALACFWSGCTYHKLYKNYNTYHDADNTYHDTDNSYYSTSDENIPKSSQLR